MDIEQIFTPQFDASGSEILLQPMQLRGAGNWKNPRLLGQQPCQRCLCACRPFLGRDLSTFPVSPIMIAVNRPI